MAAKTTSEILSGLQAMGDERAVRIWGGLGVDTTNYYGVGLTKVQAYAKTVGKSHETALALWESGNHDARILATWVEEPKKATTGQLETWAHDCDFWDLSDKLCQNVVGKTPWALEKMRSWQSDPKTMVRRSAFILLVNLAKTGKVSTEELRLLLQRIKENLQTEHNWVKEAMNYALLSIGTHCPELLDEAVGVAQRIGPVHVEYGPSSSCKAPDVLTRLTQKQGTIQPLATD